MAVGDSLGSSIDLVERGRDTADKTSLVSQTSAGQVTVEAPAFGLPEYTPINRCGYNGRSRAGRSTTHTYETIWQTPCPAVNNCTATQERLAPHPQSN